MVLDHIKNLYVNGAAIVNYMFQTLYLKLSLIPFLVTWGQHDKLQLWQLDMANVLAKSGLFSNPEDTKQLWNLLVVMFLVT